MPTYEYRCPQGHHFEQFQRMSDAPVDKCPECGHPAERLLSAGGGLIFKGSGFYITDYRGDSYKKAAEADSGKPAAEAKTDSSKSEPAKTDSARSDPPKSDSPKSDSTRSDSSRSDSSKSDQSASAPAKADVKPSGGASPSD